MTQFIDLSHDFADGMSRFTMFLPDGSRLRCTASMPIRAFAKVT